MYDFGTRQARSNNRAAYRPHEINDCPGCGQSQWLIGRLTAECAVCATALPLMTGGNFGNTAMPARGRRARTPLAA